ncbi:hypothetical protein ACWERW_38020 [Streptomyces sp. NPDC004012]
MAGRLVRAPLGSGAATVTLGGVQRSMITLPVGDLEAARRVGRRDRLRACPADCASRGAADVSYAYAEATAPDGRVVTAELSAGKGAR